MDIGHPVFPILPGKWFYSQGLTDHFQGWNLPAGKIRWLQEAFCAYMRQGLSFGDVRSHIDCEYDMPEEHADRCVIAYASLVLSVPHRELSELVIYAMNICSENQDWDTLMFRALDSIFKQNPYRKYLVMSSLEEKAQSHLETLALMTKEDAILACIVNDPAHAARLVDRISERDKADLFTQIRYRPERVTGATIDTAGYLGHAEVISMLGWQTAAILATKTNKTHLYDRALWIQKGPPDLDDKWNLESLRSESLDHGVLELAELARTLKQFPDRCLDQMAMSIEYSKASSSDGRLLSKLVDTVLEAGIDSLKLYYRVCTKMSEVAYVDMMEYQSDDRDTHLRTMLKAMHEGSSLPIKELTMQLVAREPVQTWLRICETDEDLEAAYSAHQDNRLLNRMSSSARDRSFSADLGI